MDPEPPNVEYYTSELLAVVLLTNGSYFGLIIFLILLIISSGLISGSEVAFFSISPQDAKTLEEDETVTNKRLIALREKPRTLLATILISNNLINIAIVILSYFVINSSLPEAGFLSVAESIVSGLSLTFVSIQQLADLMYFAITAIGVTAVLLLFGEVAPKIYANVNNLKFAKSMSLPLTVMNVIFGPLSKILVSWSNRLENRLTRNGTGSSYTSKEDIDAAIDLTVQQTATSGEEAHILKSILKFGDLSAKQIMKSRVDVVAVDQNIGFAELLQTIRKEGYSRIPIYDEDFDKVTGILYVKDLLGHAEEKEDFKWQHLIRDNVLYAPESKKIDELLKEFQTRRLHLAIVVDEYGGSAGIVTLEDIMEEVIGDIKDEFDEHEEQNYFKIGEGNYIFDGKMQINDACKILGCDSEDFATVRGESDTLAGLVLEIEGQIPKMEREIIFGKYRFKIIAVTNRRIEKINLVVQV